MRPRKECRAKTKLVEIKLGPPTMARRKLGCAAALQTLTFAPRTFSRTETRRPSGSDFLSRAFISAHTAVGAHGSRRDFGKKKEVRTAWLSANRPIGSQSTPCMPDARSAATSFMLVPLVLLYTFHLRRRLTERGWLLASVAAAAPGPPPMPPPTTLLPGAYQTFL